LTAEDGTKEATEINNKNADGHQQNAENNEGGENGIKFEENSAPPPNPQFDSTPIHSSLSSSMPFMPPSILAQMPTVENGNGGGDLGGQFQAILLRQRMLMMAAASDGGMMANIGPLNLWPPPPPTVHDGPFSLEGGSSTGGSAQGGEEENLPKEGGMKAKTNREDTEEDEAEIEDKVERGSSYYNGGRGSM
jgi:hypothetical protein